MVTHAIKPSAAVTKDYRRFRSKPKYIIDLFAGDHSLAKYYLRQDPRCRILCIDIRDKDDSLRTVPKHLWSRIVYIQFNIKHITYLQVQEWVRKAWDVGMEDVYHCHASPDCRTLSKADRGRTGYRLDDGSPNPYAAPYKQAIVAEHDAALNATLTFMSDMATKHPNACLTVENPVGYFSVQPQVRAMLRSGEGWRLKVTHYCKAANTKFDGDKSWSMKPTHILIRGGASDLELPQCNLDCPHRLSADPSRHTTTIRIDSRSHPSQTKVTCRGE